MKTMLLSSMIFSTVFASPAVLSAAPCSPMYLNLGVGYGITTQNSGVTNNSVFHYFEPTATPSGASNFILPNVHWENSYHNGFIGNVALGYRFLPCLRGEAEFVYQNYKRDITGTYDWIERDAQSDNIFAKVSGNRATPTSSTANIYALMGNVYYDFNLGCNWIPFIGGGLGIAYMNSDGTLANGTLEINTTFLLDGIVGAPGTPPTGPAAPGVAYVASVPALQTSPKLYGYALAWQLKAGVGYKIYENLMISGVYRLFGTTRFQATENSVITNPNEFGQSLFYVQGDAVRGLIVNAFEINFQYSFWG